MREGQHTNGPNEGVDVGLSRDNGEAGQRGSCPRGNPPLNPPGHSLPRSKLYEQKLLVSLAYSFVDFKAKVPIHRAPCES